MSDETRLSPAAYPLDIRKGDKVVEILRGFGEETREERTVLYVRKGLVAVDNGPGNDPTLYDAATGRYEGGDGMGFTRRIERV